MRESYDIGLDNEELWVMDEDGILLYRVDYWGVAWDDILNLYVY